MCTPTTIIKTAFDTLNFGVNAVNSIQNTKNLKNTYDYQTQVAINNAKQAQNEAMRQNQLGIEKSRLEKIKGKQMASKQIAAASASGFDLSSDTNLFNFEDTKNEYDNYADSILNSYKENSNKYLQQANSYLDEARTIQQDKSQALKKNNLNYLKSSFGVAQNWYDSYSK